MARYRMSDGMVVDTDLSTCWNEGRSFDGRNMISLATNSQWDHQALHRSRRGRYYVEIWSDWQGSKASAEWVSNEEACRWLALNGHPIPEELAALVDDLVE